MTYLRFILAVALATLSLPVVCEAAFPGGNGRIAFSGWTSGQGQALGSYDVYSVNPDGTGLQRLTTNQGQDSHPSWSPNGRTVVFDRGGLIYTVNSDGSGEDLVSELSNGANEYSPTWSPDGTQLAFDASRGPGAYITPDLWVMNADGSQETRLTQGDPQDTDPSWSPDGSRIAFARWGPPYGIYITDGTTITPVYERHTTSAGVGLERADWSPDGSKLAFAASDGNYSQIYTVNPDGTGLVQLTSNSLGHSYPTWSPDGNQIAFVSSRTGPADIYVMNADGSNETDVTNTPALHELQPSWQPLVETPAYPRPKGATPLSVSLVLAFRECVAPSAQHGPPLSVGSCPPSTPWHDVSVGTPDVNGAGAHLTGRMRFDIVADNTPGLTDDSDVRTVALIRDLRCVEGSSFCGSPNDSGMPDYTGELQGNITMQITDTRNGPTGTDPATTQEMTLTFAIPCPQTADSPEEGSACGILTSFNAIAPGMVKRHVSALTELPRVAILDGGEDGLSATTADNEPFAEQGVFVP